MSDTKRSKKRLIAGALRRAFARKADVGPGRPDFTTRKPKSKRSKGMNMTARSAIADIFRAKK